MLHTVKKIGPVLDLFTPERPEWRMSDIARALEMPKSSAHALVATLAEIGLLSVTGTGRYRLGWNLLSLSERMRASMDFRTHALPAMQQLAKLLRETVLLAALDRHDVVYVERAEGSHPMVRLAGVRPGARAPAHATAVGKVLLAHREPGEVRSLMSGSAWRAYTPTTVTDLEALEQALVEVRGRGVAFDIAELVPDVACVAAPITDRYGAVIAAMSVSVPAYRFPADRSRIVKPLLQHARLASERIAASEAEQADLAIAGEPALTTVG